MRLDCLLSSFAARPSRLPSHAFATPSLLQLIGLNCNCKRLRLPSLVQGEADCGRRAIVRLDSCRHLLLDPVGYQVIRSRHHRVSIPSSKRNSWRIALRLAELPNHFRMKSFSENKENEVGSEKRFW